MGFKKSSGKLSFLFILGLLVLLPVQALNAEPVKIQSSSDSSTNGSFTLSWEIPSDSVIELQQAVAPDNNFATIYQGTDSATVITGLPNGIYRYRARLANLQDNASDWSAISSIKVEHHQLGRAFSFFVLGALVFLGTVMLIVFGSKSGREE